MFFQECLRWAQLDGLPPILRDNVVRQEEDDGVDEDTSPLPSAESSKASAGEESVAKAAAPEESIEESDSSSSDGDSGSDYRPSPKKPSPVKGKTILEPHRTPKGKEKATAKSKRQRDASPVRDDEVLSPPQTLKKIKTTRGSPSAADEKELLSPGREGINLKRST
jgi:hypothetical protein